MKTEEKRLISLGLFFIILSFIFPPSPLPAFPNTIYVNSKTMFLLGFPFPSFAPLPPPPLSFFFKRTHQTKLLRQLTIVLFFP